MMLMNINFNNVLHCALLNFIIINIIAAMSRPSHMISQLFPLSLRFSFTQIIALLIYRCNEDDIGQTIDTKTQKNTY